METMETNRRADVLLTLLIALGAEAKVLAPSSKQGKEKNTVVPVRYGCGGSTRIIQCGIGRDAVVRVGASRVHTGTIIGTIGVSGGLAPDLIPGTVIVGEQIVTHGDRESSSLYRASYAANRKLVDFLEATLRDNMISCRRGTLLCAHDPIALPEDKAEAFVKTGALAVDLESAGAAEVAERAGLPFFALRVICDPAERRLAGALFAGVDSRGNNRPARLVKPLLRRPWLLVSLCRMARDFSAALASMKKAWRVVQQPLLEQARSQVSGPDLSGRLSAPGGDV